ncbi:E3 ubiquitin-protein ligase PUB24-like [Andrographis paniculata]|uniref:E3 ubiquitin-protein ligase PUB24-like n=1 Tax=Andrographis paniculata TaxID=175694 RepID=UPI0021E738EC|nr:E3 ubiquitin-protein ligase PUB24-like [Andrographis paniculata]
MAEIDVPHYFICPISLQIMKDPVTAVTGITYDRESIQEWLSTAGICPVTKLPLTPDLTPNHMLRRLIQAWCTANAVERIPTPKSPLHKSLVRKLIRDVNNNSTGKDSIRSAALMKLAELAGEGDWNRRVMAEAGAGEAMALYVKRAVNRREFLGLEEALRVLHLTWTATSDLRGDENSLELIRTVQWVLKSAVGINTVRTNALLALKAVFENATLGLKDKLDDDLFFLLADLLRDRSLSPAARKTVLNVLIEASSGGRNRARIVESGLVFELIEMELGSPEKRTSELIFGLLAQLCSLADGRQQLLKHAGGIAVVAKRLLRVSPATDDCALSVMESIARFSATREVVMEMLRVGAVSKLCMVLQADCAPPLKKKAREVLRLHSGEWSNSPCIQVYLLTRNPR